EDGKNHRPVIIHRGVVGTMERFVAFLIEEYKGVFPVWLAPVQTKIIPVSLDAHGEEAEKLADTLRREGIRVEIDQREEKIGYKILEIKNTKIIIVYLLRDKENETNTDNFITYNEQKKQILSVEEFVSLIKEEIADKTIH